ncbi:MAG: hypothetical protein ACRC76_05125 [Proteocatella sp.]
MNTQALAIVFVWHQNDNDVVKEIIDYSSILLSRDVSKPFSRSLSMPIFFYTNWKEMEVPNEINIEVDNMLIFPFISMNMVISEKWKSYISSLCNNGNIIPVAVDEYAFKIGSEINIKNFIRIKDHSILVKEKVFLAIAHEIYRYGLNENFTKLGIGTKSALKIFISHAKDKENGIYVAKEIKKYIDNSAMQSFFDATDIAPGYRFDNEIIENIKCSSILAINSDIYSSRYWCQREIQVEKQYDRPILEVDVLNRDMDRKFPYATNIPVVRINIADGISEEELIRILTMMLIETIRFYYSKMQLDRTKTLDGSIMRCSRPPEIADLEKVLIKDEKSNLIKCNYEAIMYPDPPIYSEEVQFIEKLGIKVFTPLTKDGKCFSQKKIGISISEIMQEELIQIGQDETHLIKLSQYVSRYFLSREATLIYGGDLREGGFTEYLFLEAQILKDRLKLSEIHLLNYVAWPIYLDDERKYNEWKAKYVDLAKMIEVDVDLHSGMLIDDKVFLPPNSSENRFIWAKSLSKMRNKMIKNCDVRICAGGKKSGYKGKIPGVIEEILISIQEERPIFLLGGFGGVTQSVCKLIETGVTSEVFSEEWQKDNNLNYQELLQLYENYGEKIDYDEIVNLIKGVDLKNGLSAEENKLLFNTVFIDEAIVLILKGIQNIYS